MIRGELWWAEFGIPYGSETGYTRPVLIVQDDGFNQSKIRTVIVLPLTTNLRLAEAPGNVFLRKRETKLAGDSVIMVAQLYALDRGRFKEKISKVTKEIMEQVESGMKLVLGINQ
ncbi:MAG: type II toxin-antitoxin system PemK/MazF family toxin [Treponema sp.]|nr:type II toxin-antitoxin system PemK/MazF family toxin [Treponema sp.]